MRLRGDCIMSDIRYECIKCRQVFMFSYPPANTRCPSCGGTLYRK